MDPEIVPGMAEKIEQRRLELDLSLGAFASESGLTRQGLAPYRKGLRRRYNDEAKRGVARALRWRHDAVDRLLLGLDPVPLEDEFTLEQAIRHQETLGRHILEFRPDLVVDVDGRTQVIVEVKGGGKIREAEILKEVTHLLRPLYPEPRPGHLGEADLAEATAGARLAIAAHGADAEEQTVDPRRRPAGDAPEEPPSP